MKDGAKDVGTSSIYTVGRFDGLVLVVDTYGGSAGMVRGFLNAGTDLSKGRAIDGQSFGHCDHAYRNLGRPSQIKFRQSTAGFKVEIDGQLCFESDKISIPSGYKFGITAASADNPDSFEIFKMVVMTDNIDPSKDRQDNGGQQVLGSQEQHDGGMFGQAAGDPPAAAPGKSSGRWDSSFGDDDIADADAGTLVSSKEQFADLHSRLQSVNHHLSTIFRKMASQDSVGETRHAEIAHQLGDLKGVLSKLNRLDDLETKIGSLEGEIRRLKGDVTSKVSSSERSIKGLVADTHATMHDHVKEHAGTGHWRLIAVIIGSQLILVGGYVYYKKKKSSPKKYL